MPEVSVIITTYNRASLLKEAIKSVLGQTFRDFELIVVDDHSFSHNDVESAVKKFQDERISYFRHKENRGDAAAKNTGIKAARGEYIITLDDDDLIVPWALENLVQKFKESDQWNLGGVYGWSWWLYHDGGTLKFLNYKKRGMIFKEIIKEQVFTNILFKKDIFEKIGYYDENLTSNYDYDFYLRFAQVYAVDFVPKPLFVIRVQRQKHLSQLSRSHLELHRAVGRRFRPHATMYSGVLILKFIPPRIYVRLSIVKHRLITVFKSIFNPQLKLQVKQIRNSFVRQGIII